MEKTYSKLDKLSNYDNDVVKELAEAMEEHNALNKRIMYLESVIDQNHELRQFVWTTAEGKCLALQDIPEDHFKNILTYIVNERGQRIPDAVKAEAKRRGLELPKAQPKTLRLEAHHVFEERDNEIPF